jgi:hypothetical protein
LLQGLQFYSIAFDEVVGGPYIHQTRQQTGGVKKSDVIDVPEGKDSPDKRAYTTDKYLAFDMFVLF